MEVPFLTITLPLHIANIISLRRSSFFETFSSKKISRDVSLCSNHHFSGARFDCGHASSDRLQVRRRAEGKKKKKKRRGEILLFVLEFMASSLKNSCNFYFSFCCSLCGFSSSVSFISARFL